AGRSSERRTWPSASACWRSGASPWRRSPSSPGSSAPDGASATDLPATRGAPRVAAMKIASFNINGVKARLPALLDWLAEARPDVVAIQETKSVDDAFPRAEIEDAGYAVELHGQKSFNGVALLSRLPLEDVTRGLPGD